MPNTNAKRDENRGMVGLGWDATNSVTKPFLVDPSTGRLLIAIVATSGGSPTVHSQPFDGDENRESCAGGVTDDASADPISFHIDATSGYLSVDVLIE